LARADAAACASGGEAVEVEAFIRRWAGREGGAERANYQMFLAELCGVIGVEQPDVASAARAQNDYVFERAVKTRESEGAASSRRIDLYKKGCFILEAKQSRLPGKKNAILGQHDVSDVEPARLGRRGAGHGWDVMMQNARQQAERYVFLLDTDHPAPPFIITCDVGHAFELYADFTGTGRAYSQFPDRKGFRIYLEDLRREEVRALLARIWSEPLALDPAREQARVTRQIAARLAEVSKALEKRKHDKEDVAQFLMRCIFTMFAEDVELLPKDCFKALLRKCVADPDHFKHRLEALWQDMDKGTKFSGVIDAEVRHFNGGLFRDTTVFPLGRDEIAELLAAAEYRWTEVDPAIFGTLLEQALDPDERKKLGAHYTPRAYVQRLVEVTVMEPLRADWQRALTKAESAKDAGSDKRAIQIVSAFHHQLCTTRVLDPACGTANFLYVSLELMKKLEGEVLETLARLGATESLGLEGEEVDPHQFLGLERNPRAAAIAELVVWLGYLQQHYKTKTGHPKEPILRAFKNINFGRREGYDAVLTWDGWPATKGGKQTLPNARRPDWPAAEFIVGNPPFIGGKDIRARLGALYAESLWSAHDHMNESADFVMYWWDRAAELLVRKGTPLRRFGLVTTNSISQVFQRRVMERHLSGKAPMSIVFAIADHPWTKATKDSAAVRIAMTVGEAGHLEGNLNEVITESGLDTDDPRIGCSITTGTINSDLTSGFDLTRAGRLRANIGLASRGVVLHGAGFIVTPAEAKALGLGRRPGLENHIVEYRHGRDIAQRPRNVMVIDLYPLTSAQVRQRFPEVYQHVLETVKPERDHNNMDFRRNNWWWFGATHEMYRNFVAGIPRFITTPETSKHRIFSFLSSAIRADNMLVNIGLADAACLSILSSKIHLTWALAAGGWLGFGNDPRYSKSRCFDPFPFPDPATALHRQLGEAGEELDELRKRVLKQHSDLTLTGLYNVLEKLKSGTKLTAKDEDVKDRGLVLILKELHETIDRLTAQAYGWPADLSDEQVLARLVALNAERAREEAAGKVRWLRPDYQIPCFAKTAAPRTGEMDLGPKIVAFDKRLPAWPSDRDEHPLVVEAMLLSADEPMDAAAVARGFRSGGKKIEKRVESALHSLARYGRISALRDGRFVARRAA